ncbi:hypothetical protein D3C78_1556060 [compost metagenome]
MGHGIGNVVEFQVQEYLEAARLQLLQQLRAGGGKQLLADLQPALQRVKTGGKGQRGIGGGKIQCHQHRRGNVGSKARRHQGIHVVPVFNA